MKKSILATFALSALLLTGCGSDQEVSTYKQEMSGFMRDHRMYNIEILDAMQVMIVDDNNNPAQNQFLDNYTLLSNRIQEFAESVNVPDEYKEEHEKLMIDIVSLGMATGDIGSLYLEYGSKAIIEASKTNYLDMGASIEDFYVENIENGDGTYE